MAVCSSACGIASTSAEKIITAISWLFFKFGSSRRIISYIRRRTRFRRTADFITNHHRKPAVFTVRILNIFQCRQRRARRLSVFINKAQAAMPVKSVSLL